MVDKLGTTFYDRRRLTNILNESGWLQMFEDCCFAWRWHWPRSDGGQALKVLDAAQEKFAFQLAYHLRPMLVVLPLIGTARALPEDTLRLCEESDAILFGSVGGPQVGNPASGTAARAGAPCCPCASTSTCFATFARQRFFPPWQAAQPPSSKNRQERIRHFVVFGN